ncbi:hypothetical protein EXU57_14680 [Segetibacter sp. 3557_3]|uniref:baeRF3 domain-containing protein n=1 Tax=Segetibacter sp. 3557_3 TaxID=2547429 RepID=UPI0010588AD7|nr:hypothetical protein [Segetibacter sp. 3557_3]TDH24583.1 hypothetical protein EXU57_14680 [Segetibacter sp. 3557_3]
MENLNQNTINELKTVSTAPCLSLYMTTHRNHPDNLQDPIKFKNQVKQLEESIAQYNSADDSAVLLAPFEALLADKQFWAHTLDGLAVFSARDYFKVVRVPVTFNDLAVVADNFHIKPLKKYLQSADRFQVLGLSLRDFQLYEGNRHAIAQVDLPEDFPNTIEAALGAELTEEHLTVASYGGVGGNQGNMVHGHGSRKDELDIDAERFFRAAADVVYKEISKPSGLPLILAALPEHHSLFQKVNKNPLLLKEGIMVNPKSVDTERFLQMAWDVMKVAYTENLKSLANAFEEASSKNLGSDAIDHAAKAAAESRVDVLLVEADKVVPGMLDEENGTIKKGSLEHPEVDDLLDDIGELVSARGGKVVVVPKEFMPTATGLAATYRFELAGN